VGRASVAWTTRVTAGCDRYDPHTCIDIHCRAGPGTFRWRCPFAHSLHPEPTPPLHSSPLPALPATCPSEPTPQHSQSAQTLEMVYKARRRAGSMGRRLGGVRIPGRRLSRVPYAGLADGRALWGSVLVRVVYAGL
jgi:hypothetical protein